MISKMRYRYIEPEVARFEKKSAVQSVSFQTCRAGKMSSSCEMLMSAREWKPLLLRVLRLLAGLSSSLKKFFTPTWTVKLCKEMLLPVKCFERLGANVEVSDLKLSRGPINLCG